METYIVEKEPSNSSPIRLLIHSNLILRPKTPVIEVRPFAMYLRNANGPFVVLLVPLLPQVQFPVLNPHVLRFVLSGNHTSARVSVERPRLDIPIWQHGADVRRVRDCGEISVHLVSEECVSLLEHVATFTFCRRHQGEE